MNQDLVLWNNKRYKPLDNLSRRKNEKTLLTPLWGPEHYRRGCRKNLIGGKGVPWKAVLCPQHSQTDLTAAKSCSQSCLRRVCTRLHCKRSVWNEEWGDGAQPHPGELPAIKEGGLGERKTLPQRYGHWRVSHASVDNSTPMPMKALGYHGSQSKARKIRKEDDHLVEWLEGWCKKEGDKCDPNVLHKIENCRRIHF